LGEATEYAGEESGAEDRKEGRRLPQREHDEERQGQKIHPRDGERVREDRERLVRVDAGLWLRRQPEEEEGNEREAECGARSPEHVPNVLRDGESAADELRDEDRRLRQHRHLVAEIRAADDGARG